MKLNTETSSTEAAIESVTPWSYLLVGALLAAATTGCSDGAPGRMDTRSASSAVLEAPDAAEFLIVQRRDRATDSLTLVERRGTPADANRLIEGGEHALALGVSADSTGETTTFRDVPLVRSTLSAAQRAARPTYPRTAVPARTAGADAARIARNGDAGDELDLLVGLHEVVEVGPIKNQIDDVLSTAGPNEYSVAEIRALRQQLTRQQLDRVHSAHDAMVSSLEAAGATYIESFAVANAVRVVAPRGNLESLARITDVASLSENMELALLGEGGVETWEAIRAAQLDQFVNDGFTGDAHGGASNVKIGFIDKTFEDDFDSITDSRVVARWDCWSSPCVQISDMDSALVGPVNLGLFVIEDDRHGTAVAQIAAGLSSGVAGAVNPRSGVARTADIAFVRVLDAAGYLRGLDAFAVEAVDIVSSSMRNPSTGSPDGCQQDHLIDSSVNALSRLYQVLWVQAAGNDGHATTDCTTSSPAAATYALTVGAIMNEADARDSYGIHPNPSYLPDYEDIQSAAIADYSSRGGEPYLFGQRTIIDATALGIHLWTPEGPGMTDYGNDGYPLGVGQGTSFAQPVVAGGAASMIDWWLDQGHTLGSYSTTFINQPGFTKVQVLGMGDRVTEAGTKTMSGYDSLFGGGRFRARRFDSSHMDVPWGMEIFNFYVNDGGTYSIAVAGGLQLSSDVDRLMVAMFWPEEDYSNGADIVLQLRRTCGSGTTPGSDMSFDTKKRVYMDSGVGNSCWAIDVTAFDAPTSYWFGGQRRLVYLMYYWEDGDRDSLWSGIQ